ncbi:MAG: amino acid-binding protein [Tissierellia bacterium]|nr:amino acid-binding protein [Tissierellia bacterium]
MAKQLTVFIENKKGSLNRLTKILKEEMINIISFSLADTKDFGILRLMVSDPERAVQALKARDISARLTDITAVRLSIEVGSLYELLEELKDFNIQYLYVYSNREDSSGVILKITEKEEAEQHMKDCGYRLLTDNEVYLDK